MIRNPFFPALFAFLFSSLFSFAASAVQGEWERLDGNARLRVKLDGAGRLQGSLSKLRAAHPDLARRSATRRRPLSPLRRWRGLVQPRERRVGGTLYEADSRQRHKLGSVSLRGSDRLQLRDARSGRLTEWRRLS